MYSTVQYKILYMLQERIRLLVIHICTLYKIGAAQHRLGKQEVKNTISYIYVQLAQYGKTRSQKCHFLYIQLAQYGKTRS